MEDPDDGWLYCELEEGHKGPHRESRTNVPWLDTEVVEVRTPVQAVPHQVYDFVGDEDTCVRNHGCQLTWSEYLSQKHVRERMQQ
jgi:hypothetical protein